MNYAKVENLCTVAMFFILLLMFIGLNSRMGLFILFLLINK